jgi:hypothetical protein
MTWYQIAAAVIGLAVYTTFVAGTAWMLARRGWVPKYWLDDVIADLAPFQDAWFRSMAERRAADADAAERRKKIAA